MAFQRSAHCILLYDTGAEATLRAKVGPKQQGWCQPVQISADDADSREPRHRPRDVQNKDPGADQRLSSPRTQRSPTTPPRNQLQHPGKLGSLPKLPKSVCACSSGSPYHPRVRRPAPGRTSSRRPRSTERLKLAKTLSHGCRAKTWFRTRLGCTTPPWSSQAAIDSWSQTGKQGKRGEAPPISDHCSLLATAQAAPLTSARDTHKPAVW